jgi:hypothetical protein
MTLLLAMAMSWGIATAAEGRTSTLAENGHTTSPGPGGVPMGIKIHWETLQRKGCRGDNWCMTWAADDNIYTMMDDGGGFHAYKPEWGTRLWRIPGNEDFTAEQAVPVSGWPFTDGRSPFYGYGTYSVRGRIYTWLWKSETDRGYSRPVANRLLYTDDFGKTFFRWDGTKVTAANFSDTDKESFFFYQEDPRPKAGREAYAFNWIAFCQNGKDNSAAKDDYVYMYCVEQHDVTRLSMIRVPQDKVTDRSAYEYLQEVLGEQAVWTSDMARRGATITYPAMNYNGDDWLWCSWHPSVVYNPGLDCYIMVSYGISDGSKDFFSGWCSHCRHSATVGMWHARNPWGPWTQFYYQTEWKSPDDPPAEWGFSGAASRTYQFKFNPKWIYDNGRTMYLIWSDAGGRWDSPHYGHSDYWYRWNQVKITLDIRPHGFPDSAQTHIRNLRMLTDGMNVFVCEPTCSASRHPTRLIALPNRVDSMRSTSPTEAYRW